MGLYGRGARWILHHRRLVGLVVVALTLVGVLMTTQLNVDADLLALSPRGDRWSQDLQDLRARTDGGNVLAVTFSGEEPALSEVADAAAAAIQDLPEVRYVVHDLDPALLTHLALLQLDPDEVRAYTARVQGALDLGPALNPIIAAQLVDPGPLGQRPELPPILADQGRRNLLILPTGPPNDRELAEALLDGVEAAVAATGHAERGVELVWIGGAYRNNVEDVRAVRGDLVRLSGIAAVLVLVVLAVGFRSLRLPALLFIPLVPANAMNLGLTWAVLGSVNTYTSLGTAILLGLGIDFGVHLIGRYREERARGRTLEEAVVIAWDRTGPPCTTAAITSAAGFVSLAAARFRGFSQLGLVLAVGLLLALAFVLVTLPVLLPLLDPPPPRGSAVPERSRHTYPLAPWGAVLMVALTALAIWRVPELGWEHDMSALRPTGMAYSELSEDEQALAEATFPPVAITYPDAASLRADQERLQALVDAGELPHVAQVVSMERLLPVDQADRVAALAALRALQASPYYRNLPGAVIHALDPLRTWEPVTLDREDLPPGLRHLLLAETPDDHHLLLWLQGNLWDMSESAVLCDELRGAVPERPIAGTFTVIGSVASTVQGDLPRIVGVALVLVSLIALADLRSLVRAAVAIGALVVGLLWAGAVLERGGVRLNMVNIVGVPILVGIGVDVIIHLLHRLHEEGPGSVRLSLRTTGVAAALSVLTTMASFSALLWATARGVRSLGLLVVLGLATVSVAGALGVVVAQALGWRRQRLKDR